MRPVQSLPRPRGDRRSHRGAAAAQPSIDGIDWVTPIDLTRWFLCETVTPLYYTPVYADLSEAQRRRYNQLTGMFANELIAFLEREFLTAALEAVRARRGELGESLLDALARFEADEQRHLQLWTRLNTLSDPGRYRRTDRAFLRVPGWAGWLARQAARYPHLFPVVLWIQLVQEERSISISRRCLGAGAARIEPRYLTVYAEHLRDEARHVQIDCQLIDGIYRGRSRATRWYTAAVFDRLISAAFLLPGGSTRRIIGALAREYPDLRDLVPVIHDQLARLADNDAYLRMMYSRETTPVSFRMFDRFPEFRRLQSRLRDRPAPGRVGHS